MMHQTRKTHNAHNETQRRLKKVLSNSHTSTLYAVPHYSCFCYTFGRARYIPDWANQNWSDSVHYNGKGGLFWFDSLEEAESERKHRFLVKSSKSSGRHSYYKYAKKLIHKMWRRRGFGDATYTVKRSFCSWKDVGY